VWKDDDIRRIGLYIFRHDISLFLISARAPRTPRLEDGGTGRR